VCCSACSPSLRLFGHSHAITALAAQRPLHDMRGAAVGAHSPAFACWHTPLVQNQGAGSISAPFTTAGMGALVGMVRPSF
jgi:hypothetical protein